MQSAMNGLPPISPNSVRLNVAGLEVVVAPTDAELGGPVCELFRLFRDSLDDLPVGRRIVVGLAGPPGSGKSTWATLLAYLSTRRMPPTPAAAVSIDGWHWPNAVLASMSAAAPDGSTVSMRARKGSPGSFDVGGILAALEVLRDAHRPARIPVYDRHLHEPVAAGQVVAPGIRLILLEGNYVLSREEPWRAVAEQLDLALYLDRDLEECRDAVLARHVAGGLSWTEAAQKFETNDRLNTDIVAATRRFADVVLRVGPQHRLTGIEILRRRARSAFRGGRFPGVGHRDPF